MQFLELIECQEGKIDLGKRLGLLVRPAILLWMIRWVVEKIVGPSPAIFSVMEKSVSGRRRSFPLLRKASWFPKYYLDEENNHLDRKEHRSDSCEIVSASKASATQQRRSAFCQRQSAKIQSRLFSSKNALIFGFDNRLRSFADCFMSEPIVRVTKTIVFEPETIFSWLRRSSLRLCRCLWHKADRLCVEADFFVALPIVFAAKPIVLRLGKASPVPCWLFLELAARSHHY